MLIYIGLFSIRAEFSWR